MKAEDSQDIQDVLDLELDPSREEPAEGALAHLEPALDFPVGYVRHADGVT
jgi:hypothetical protein